MHLLVTAADDGTSDLLCERLGDKVLRLNWERWSDYSLDIDAASFRIADRFGREVTQCNLGNVIWRKPVTDIDRHPGEQWYSFQEFKYAVQAILQQVRLFAPHKLRIDPHYNLIVDKFRQLQVAKRYMCVPRWRMTSSPSTVAWDDVEWVVKSTTGRPLPVHEGKFAPVIYTTPVDPNDLADGFPWFVQEAVAADYDLTIVFVDGRQFAFLLARKLFPGMDWRASIGTPSVDSAWAAVTLPQSLCESTRSIMRDLNLQYGRLDLLVSDATCSNPVFLEVNPNGQWAWLDPRRDNGLFDAVVQFLTA